eukprot:5899801-Alexandrium_andersonii.AAC.1
MHLHYACVQALFKTSNVCSSSSAVNNHCLPGHRESYNVLWVSFERTAQELHAHDSSVCGCALVYQPLISRSEVKI